MLPTELLISTGFPRPGIGAGAGLEAGTLPIDVWVAKDFNEFGVI